MTTFKSRKMSALALFLGLFCLMRAVQASAAERDFDEMAQEEEVYDGRGSDGEDDGRRSWGSRGPASDDLRHEVRFTRPEEAARHKVAVFGEDEYEQIDGAEYLRSGKGTSRAPASAIPVPAAPHSFKPATELKVESHGNRPDAAESQAWASARREQAAAESTLAPQARTEGRAVETSPIPVRESYGATAEARIPVAANDSNEEPRMSASRARGIQEVSVIVSDHGFFPERIFVTQGIPVRVYLTTSSRTTSCFMVDAFAVRKGINPGNVEEVRFLPERSGEFRYYCPVGAIEGKMTVRAPASVSATP